MLTPQLLTNRSKVGRICQVAGESTEADIRRHYSGRGMYGDFCMGIATAHPDDVIAEVGIPGARRDSLGKRWIVYWPGVTFEELDPD